MQVHGTRSSYNKHGCRCGACRAWNADRGRRQYHKRAKEGHKRHSQKRDIVRAMKQRPCADCGVQYPYYVMQFDHLRDKEFDISQALSSVSLARLLAEIEKCDVVCANCHAMRTWQRR